MGDNNSQAMAERVVNLTKDIVDFIQRTTDEYSLAEKTAALRSAAQVYQEVSLVKASAIFFQNTLNQYKD